MVEGPGCKLKGEKLKATVSGQKVEGVAGTVVDNKPKKASKSSTPYHLLLGHHVVDVKTLGKELFIILDHRSCVRVHFLMDGFVRYNYKQTDPDEVINHIVMGTDKNKEPEHPRLEFNEPSLSLIKGTWVARRRDQEASDDCCKFFKKLIGSIPYTIN